MCKTRTLRVKPASKTRGNTPAVITVPTCTPTLMPVSPASPASPVSPVSPASLASPASLIYLNLMPTPMPAVPHLPVQG
jgi:hypothetical protein